MKLRFPNFLKKQKRFNSGLVGIWKSDLNDIPTRKNYGDIRMEFTQNGELIYSILTEGKLQQIFLTYKVDGNLLITDQPSSPQEIITEFIIQNQELELCFEGTISKFIKLT